MPVGEDVATYRNRYQAPQIANMADVGSGAVTPSATTATAAASAVPNNTTVFQETPDPTGSLYDAFERSLNQATMPAQFRATWG